MTIIISHPIMQVLSESLFPPRKPKEQATLGRPSDLEVEAEKDPLATRTWRLSTKAKDNTVFICTKTKKGISPSRLENLMWRLMTKKRSEQAAREKSGSLLEPQSPPSKIVENANEPVISIDSSELETMPSPQIVEYSFLSSFEDDTAADKHSIGVIFLPSSSQSTIPPPGANDIFTSLLSPASPMLCENDLNTQLAPHNDTHQESNQNSYVSSQVKNGVTRRKEVPNNLYTTKVTEKRIGPGMACSLHRKQKKKCPCASRYAYSSKEHRDHNPYPTDVALEETRVSRRPGSSTTDILEEFDRFSDSQQLFPMTFSGSSPASCSISTLNILSKHSEMVAQAPAIPSTSEAVIIGIDTQTDISNMQYMLSNTSQRTSNQPRFPDGSTFGVPFWSFTVPYDPNIGMTIPTHPWI
ncbi:hypothetical protein BC937DRAFT_90116 [Endogone sp. FLAS-F59071]|nr:hypothetical protein BC937DRAFT_90116 [Endogone sp. FLAS-F59071]|eukprot:RUS17326.1 hypothetical protein BC937DRAFT_90116 [Endogone sp. FLAS-F59071]